MHPSAMEPLLPTTGAAAREAAATEVVRRSAALGAHLHPIARMGLVERLRRMNSYYSNLIEDHATHPLDIDRALAADFVRDPRRRALQREAAAHVEVQRLVEDLLERQPDLDVTSPAFLCLLHRWLYERLPEPLRRVPGERGEEEVVEPGALRHREVRVGRHVPPPALDVPAFLQRFAAVFGRLPSGSVAAVAALGPAHHRLAWIHPFLDGNGRVTRLFTDAWLRRHRVDGHGLWTMSRAFARHRDRYFAGLAEADEPRRGDLDGRGALSEQSLARWADFTLELAVDQIDFMTGLLELDGLTGRVSGWVQRRHARRELPLVAGRLLVQLLVLGEVPRGEAGRVLDMPDRTARLVTSKLVREGVLWSETPKGPLRLAFPAHVCGDWFPKLYPNDVDEQLRATLPPT